MQAIPVCPRAATGIRDVKPSLVWPRGQMHAMGAEDAEGNKTELSYFLLCTPPDLLETTVRETSARLVLKNFGEGKPVSKHELLKSFGVMFALPHSGQTVARDNWGTDDDAIFRPAEFGARWGVACNRHEEIMASLTMRPDCAPWNDPADPWQCCTYFEQQFNDHMPTIMRASVARPSPCDGVTSTVTTTSSPTARRSPVRRKEQICAAPLPLPQARAPA